MSLIKWEDHTHDAYSNNGRAYTVKARQSKDTSLDTKHLCIRLALAEARVMILFMWLLSFRLFSTVTPRNRNQDWIDCQSFGTFKLLGYFTQFTGFNTWASTGQKAKHLFGYLTRNSLILSMTTYDEEQRTAVTVNCLREWREFHCRASARTDNLNKTSPLINS